MISAIQARYEPLIIAAMCVRNEDRSPERIDG
jgi:hypothetical protein